MYRDASARLAFSTSHLSPVDYPGICNELSCVFGLIPHGELVTDMVSVVVRKYRRDEQMAEFGCDNRMDFTVTATTPESEWLVHEVASWLLAPQQRAS